MADTSSAQIPPAALILGAAGALPFIALAIATHVLEGDQGVLAPYLLTGYGAVILSFLGGVQWGFASATNQDLSIRLAVSVMPSLIGWAALALSRPLAFHVLAISFALTLYADWRAHRDGQCPPWYIKLRIPLTIVVVLSMLIAAAAR